jgi:hypothetical protein
MLARFRCTFVPVALVLVAQLLLCHAGAQVKRLVPKTTRVRADE